MSSTIRNLRIAGHSYDVTIGGCLRVRRDGEVVIDEEGCAVVRKWS